MRAWQVAAVTGLAVFALHAGAGVGGTAADHFVEIWVYFGLEALAVVAIATRAILVPDERIAWAWLAAGLAAYTIGRPRLDVRLQRRRAGALGRRPALSVVLSGVVHRAPAAGPLATVTLQPQRLARRDRVALAVGAVGAAFLLEMALDHTEGEPLAVATNLAYPLGDVVLLALVVGVFWLVGRDAGIEWLVIGGAFFATAVADGIYLWMSAVGTYQEGSLLDILWPLMGIMLAVAAWVRPGRSRRIELEGRPLAATPMVCTVMALTVFVDDHVRHINAFALVLATATICFVLVRTLFTFRENSSIAARIRVLSITDPLTQLWNRRKLQADLEAVVGAGAASPHVLVLYDLNGFKRFNDLFGHPAGDALLVRLAAKLADVVRPHGTCYRLGGDEFCVLAPLPEGELEAFLDATAVALSESGEGFEVTTALGCAFLPEEAGDPARAMQIADQRLYARKHHSLIERGQPHGVLLQALYEREPDLRLHVGGVAALSVDLGRQLDLDDAALRELELAAQLHDIGKLAIPDAILDKAQPLTPPELEFVRRHTIIGERILSAAPALSQVGSIVRATHEAVDGSGYPDGLRGAEIPLAARIIAVCDAYSAMTSDRPYQAHRSHADALAELRAVAGSQLDSGARRALLRDGRPRRRHRGSTAAHARYGLARIGRVTEIRSIGVVGLGAMGAGIAQLAIEAGYDTVGREVTTDLGQAAAARIGHFLTRKVEKGKLEEEARDAAVARLGVTTELEALANCDLVIEAIVEEIEPKLALFADLDRHLPARRDPRDEHVGALRRPRSRRRRAGRSASSGCTSSTRPR